MASELSQYRKSDIDARLCQARFRPLDIMVTGVTGAGKSTTLNSFFQKTVAAVGSGVDPETMELDAYELNDSFRLWDTPGLGDGVERDKIHKKKLIDLLYKTYSMDGNIYGFIDLVLIIIEGANRDMGTTYTLLNEVIIPNIQRDRILIAINQADVSMKSRHWNNQTNMPDEQLQTFLRQQAISVKKRIKEASGMDIITPICYSAQYGYNVKQLFDFIIDNMPLQRRPLKG